MFTLTPEIREQLKKVLAAILLAVLSILGYEKVVIEPMFKRARERSRQSGQARNVRQA